MLHIHKDENQKYSQVKIIENDYTKESLFDLKRQVACKKVCFNEYN